MANGLLGKGKVKIAAYSSGSTINGRLYNDFGNSSVLSPGFSEEEKSIANFQTAAGGKADSFKRIDAFTLQLTGHEYTADNLARIAWGTATATTATPIVGEAGGKYNAGAFVPTLRPVNTAVAPVVKKGGTTINTADYVVSSGGITFISGTPATAGLVAGDAIAIDYTPKAGKKVEALTTTAPEVSVLFEGINANTNRLTTAWWYRCRMGVPSEIPLIGDEFAAFQIQLEVLQDTTIVGVGESQYWHHEIAD